MLSLHGFLCLGLVTYCTFPPSAISHNCQHILTRKTKQVLLLYSQHENNAVSVHPLAQSTDREESIYLHLPEKNVFTVYLGPLHSFYR